MIKNSQKLKLSIGLAIVLSVFFAFQVNAARILTEKQIKAISTSCKSAQVELNKIHNSDALIRTNLGRHYESVLGDLMTPFNYRVSINDLDNSKLLDNSRKYEATLKDFRVTYIDYEKTIRKTMDMDCSKSPIEFYQSLEDVRSKRKELKKEVDSLSKYIKLYRKEVQKIKESIGKSGE